MSRKALPLVLVLLCLFSGCTTAPRNLYANVNDSYIAVLQGLLEAYDAGKFSNEQWAGDIVPLIVLGDQLLDTYNAATAAGQEAPVSYAHLQEVLVALNQFLLDRGFFTSG